ncbi:hypothetical protein XENORESO_008451 [Xenotaenia resolanae]|uniref:Uncharacterized protein n=1 Tax=Xenotaenia resolanae TaxID=208358 RepID=A0ABV0WQ28_9TELE
MNMDAEFSPDVQMDRLGFDPEHGHLRSNQQLDFSSAHTRLRSPRLTLNKFLLVPLDPNMLNYGVSGFEVDPGLKAAKHSKDLLSFPHYLLQGPLSANVQLDYHSEMKYVVSPEICNVTGLMMSATSTMELQVLRGAHYQVCLQPSKVEQLSCPSFCRLESDCPGDVLTQQ